MTVIVKIDSSRPVTEGDYWTFKEKYAPSVWECAKCMGIGLVTLPATLPEQTHMNSSLGNKNNLIIYDLIIRNVDCRVIKRKGPS